MKPDSNSRKGRRKNVPSRPEATVPPRRPPSLGMAVSVCIFLAVMVWAVFGQTLGYEFVNYDDPGNVSDNPTVRNGLSWRGVVWAFTHTQVGHWDPLTTISHMADCQIYGHDPMGHHLTNVVLHAVSAMLLFLLLRELTSAFWRSAFVAAIFAVHPLRVESVAWITERKDVLSGLFFLLTLWAYLWYVRKPEARRRYLAVAGLFALGLMCKSMLVTLPAVLLLLDFWPLGRMTRPDEAVPARLWRLIREKIPLVLLSGASCVGQLIAAKEMMDSLEKWPLSWRFGNAVVSYAAYVGQTLWPTGLAVYYPHPRGGLASGEVAAATLLLFFASGAAWVSRRKYPYFLTGWFWFLGMLVPVIGLVPAGLQARADRYTYLPHIGLSVALTWLAVELCAGLRVRRWVLGGVAAVAVMAMIWRAQVQASFWKNSQTLWTHALACTGPNEIGHNNLGHFLLERGMVDEAEAHIRKATEIAPDYATAHNNLGLCTLARGEVAEAVVQFQKATALRPKFAEAHGNLGTALIKAGRTDEAIAHYGAALAIAPDLAGIESNLAGALLLNGRLAESIAHYEKAVGMAPRNAGWLRTLAWVLATCPEAQQRNGPRAVTLAERARELTGGRDALVLATLAAAYAEAGRFPEAIETAEMALRSKELKSDAIANLLRQQKALFQNNTPFRETYEAKP